MELLKRINYKVLASWTLFLVTFFFSLSNIGDIKSIVQQILNWPHIQITFWAIVASCYIARNFSGTSEIVQSALVYKYFGKFADTAFTIITLAVAGSTALALLKGVYSQKIVGDAIYFTNFGDFDIWSLLVVALFLLVYSLHMSLSSLYFAVVNSSNVEVTPSNQ